MASVPFAFIPAISTREMFYSEQFKDSKIFTLTRNTSFGDAITLIGNSWRDTVDAWLCIHYMDAPRDTPTGRSTLSSIISVICFVNV